MERKIKEASIPPGPDERPDSGAAGGAKSKLIRSVDYATSFLSRQESTGEGLAITG